MDELDGIKEELEEELEDDLMSCGWDDFDKVDELEEEYLARAEDIENEQDKQNMIELIRLKIGNWLEDT